MADGGTGEKTEEPTPERLRKLREDGNVPKSQDVTAAISFLAIFCVLAGTFSFSGREIVGFCREAIDVAMRSHEESTQLTQHLFVQALISLTLASAPALAGALVLGVAMNVAQVGFMFTSKPITPDLNKINPVNGIKSMFSMKKVVEMLKNIIKFVVVSYLAYAALRDSLRDVVLILRSELFVAVKVIGGIIWDFVTKISIIFVLIAAADAFYQRKRYMKDNMMSKYDVKQEYKQSEGDPQHKSERRRMHQEIIAEGGGSAIKEADVVVRNPDHIAVALKYDKEKGSAPKVLVKGERIWAEKILAAARRYGVPVVRNVPLAQALNKLDSGDEVPEELYQAVAEVLNFVYSLAEQQKNKGR